MKNYNKNHRKVVSKQKQKQEGMILRRNICNFKNLRQAVRARKNIQ